MIEKLYKNNFILFASLLTLSFILYASLLNNTFLSDDYQLVYKIEFNKHDLHKSFFRPVSDLSIAIDYLIWRKKAVGYYITNIILLAISAFVIYHIITILLNNIKNDKRSQVVAFFSATLFLCYPYHSEAIAWISGRGALLSGLFLALSFLYYLKFSANQKKRFVFLSTLFFAISLFTYESGFTYPFILIAYFIYTNKGAKRVKSIVANNWPYLLLLAVYFLVRLYYTHGSENTYFNSTFNSRTILDLIGNYLRFIARSIVPPIQSSIHFVALTLLVFASVFLILFKLKKNGFVSIKSTIAFAIIYSLSILPVLFFGIDTHDTESERFLHTPSYILIIAVGLLIYRIRLSNHRVLFLTLLVNAAILQISLRPWSVASNICTAYMKEFKAFKHYSEIYLSNLPVQYKGAYIFRNGIEQAIDITYPESRIQKIIINSEKEVCSNNLMHSFSDLESLKEAINYTIHFEQITN